MRLLLVVLSLLTSLLGACGRSDLPSEALVSQEDALSLRLGLKVGDTFRYRTTIQSVVLRTLSERALAQDFSYTLRYQVEAVDPDGSAQVRATYEDVTFLMNFGGEPISFPNPDGEADDETSRILSRMPGQSAMLRLAPDGTLQRIEQLAPPLEPLFAPIEESDLPFALLFWRPLAVGAGSREALLGLTLGDLPHQPVAVGASWTEQRPLLPSGPSPAYTVTHTLRERADGVVTLAQAGTVDTTTVLTSTGGPLSVVSTLSLSGTDAVEEATGLSRYAKLEIAAELDEPLVQEVFTEPGASVGPVPTASLPPAEGQSAAATPTYVPPPTVDIVGSERISISTTIIRERIACCDPLPSPTQAPSPTAVPMPSGAELEALVRETLAGVVRESEVVEVRPLLEHLLVIYRGQLEAGVVFDPAATAPPDPEIVDYIIFSPGPAGWTTRAASWAGLLLWSGGDHPLRYSADWASGRGGEAAFLVGQTESPSIVAVAGLFSNGQVVRVEVPGPGVPFSLIGERAHALCQLSMLDAAGRPLDTIPVTYDAASACRSQQTPTPVP